MIVYLNDILVFDKSKEEHLMNMSQVLEQLRKKKILINLEKCSFIRAAILLGICDISRRVEDGYGKGQCNC